MSDFKPITTIASNLPNVVNGNLITTLDTGDMYVDSGGKRTKIADVITGTYADITSLLAPLTNKVYLATDTHQLLQYSGGSWTVLNSGSGGGSSGTGDWGTKAVNVNENRSIIATQSITGDSNEGIRGNGAVDLQMYRTSPHHYAKGMSSFVAGRSNSANGAFGFAFGEFNRASAHYSTVFGESNIASGKHSTVFGEQNTNTIDGVVCNNNTIPDYEAFTNVSGNCGFKGIKCWGLYQTPIWKLALTDVLIAKVHIIAVDTASFGTPFPHQIQDIIVSNCELKRNEIEFSCGQANEFKFTVNNGKLYIIANYQSYDLQIGIFYTLYSQSGNGSSSSSSSSSGGEVNSNTSSSQSEPLPYIPETSSSSSQ